MRITHLRRRVVAGRSRGRRWWRRGIGRSRRTAMVAASFSSPRPFSRPGDTLYRPDSRLQAHAQALTRGSWRLSLSLSLFSLYLCTRISDGVVYTNTHSHTRARAYTPRANYARVMVIPRPLIAGAFSLWHFSLVVPSSIERGREQTPLSASGGLL